MLVSASALAQAVAASCGGGACCHMLQLCPLTRLSRPPPGAHAPERVPGVPRAQRWWGGLVPATPCGRLTRSRRPRATCAGPAGAPASCASIACAAALGHARELHASGPRVACARARPPPGDRSAHPLGARVRATAACPPRPQAPAAALVRGSVQAPRHERRPVLAYCQ